MRKIWICLSFLSSYPFELNLYMKISWTFKINKEITSYIPPPKLSVCVLSTHIFCCCASVHARIMLTSCIYLQQSVMSILICITLAWVNPFYEKLAAHACFALLCTLWLCSKFACSSNTMLSPVSFCMT